MMNIFEVKDIDENQSPLEVVMTKCIWEPFLTYFYNVGHWSALQVKDSREHCNVLTTVFGIKASKDGAETTSHLIGFRREILCVPFNDEIVVKQPDFYKGHETMFYVTVLDFKDKKLITMNWRTFVVNSNLTNGQLCISLADFKTVYMKHMFDNLRTSTMTLDPKMIMNNTVAAICEMVLSLTDRFEKENWKDIKASDEKFNDAVHAINTEIFGCMNSNRDTDEPLRQYFLCPCTEKDLLHLTHIL